MIYLILSSLISFDTVTSIRNLLVNNQYKAAFVSANSIISKQGAIDADNILFFLRGYASVKLQNYEQGISDLTRFLATEKNINQRDKTQSYSLRCLAYLKTGKLNEATNDSNKSKNETLIKLVTKATLLYNTVTSNQSSPRYTLNKYIELIKICSSSEDFLRSAATVALSIDNNPLFIEFSEKALKISPNDGKILEMLGRYHFSQYELATSKKYTNKCINSYSESSKCSSMLKSINKFEENQKKASNFVAKKDFKQALECIKICQSIVNKYSKENSPLSNQVKKIYVKILIQKEEKEEAIECLNGLTKAFPENNEFFILRGKLLLDFGDYSGAISDFQIVKKRTKVNSTENRDVIKLIEKVSLMQEKDKNMNYYTILCLRNGANISEVKKAYKKLVVKWHADRFTDPLKKKVAEKKMMMINMAYDTLSDEAKKRTYDFLNGNGAKAQAGSSQNKKPSNSKNSNNKSSQDKKFNNKSNTNGKNAPNKNDNNKKFNNKNNTNSKNMPNKNNKYESTTKNNTGSKNMPNKNESTIKSNTDKRTIPNRNDNNASCYNNGFRYFNKKSSNKDTNSTQKNRNEYNNSNNRSNNTNKNINNNSNNSKYNSTSNANNNRNAGTNSTQNSYSYKNEYRSEYDFNDGYRNANQQRKRANKQMSRAESASRNQKGRNDGKEL